MARAAAVVTPLAWVLAGGGLAALVAGRRLGWEELSVAGATAVALLVVAAAFTLGRTGVDVEIDVRPVRVRAGDRAVAAVTTTATGPRRTLGHTMELTVGAAVAELPVPSLRGGDVHEDVLVLPTRHRAVIPVGPATSVRGDPLGLLRRSRVWTRPRPLFVHPRTVALPDLGTGLVRDLEGRATPDAAPADVAFHTMREYEPGDDRRYIHWLTTARTGTLMVRQFVDTRRTHVAVALEEAAVAYGDEDEFETAVSAAASIGVRALEEDQDLSAVAGDRPLPTVAARLFLDALAGVGLRDEPSPLIGAGLDQLRRRASGLSLAVLVSGSRASIGDLRAAAVRVPRGVRVVILRVDPGTATASVPFGDHALATLRELDDLPSLLWTMTR